MAVYKSSEEIEVFKHANRQKRVRVLMMKVIRGVKWRKRNDTDTGRIRWKGLGMMSTGG